MKFLPQRITPFLAWSPCSRTRINLGTICAYKNKLLCFWQGSLFRFIGVGKVEGQGDKGYSLAVLCLIFVVLRLYHENLRAEFAQPFAILPLKTTILHLSFKRCAKRANVHEKNSRGKTIDLRYYMGTFKVRPLRARLPLKCLERDAQGVFCGEQIVPARKSIPHYKGRNREVFSGHCRLGRN